jgi:hypothetical protein
MCSEGYGVPYTVLIVQLEIVVLEFFLPPRFSPTENYTVESENRRNSNDGLAKLVPLRNSLHIITSGQLMKFLLQYDSYSFVLIKLPLRWYRSGQICFTKLEIQTTDSSTQLINPLNLGELYAA